MKNLSKDFVTDVNGPMLDKVKINFDSSIDFNKFPFSLNIIKKLKTIEFPTQVTFIIGENGTGKSTILEAIAGKTGFGPEGGSMNMNFKTAEEGTYSGVQNLAEHTTLSWRRKPKDGYFFRAESFFNVANYIDLIGREGGSGKEKAYAPYGGISLHEQSHGESFLSFFKNRVGNNGFFIFDEPEAALSPQRQLSLISIINELCRKSNAQFVIATHSPILLAYPDSTIYSCDSDVLTTIAYKDTTHYKITKNFLDNPSRYLHYLLNDSV